MTPEELEKKLALDQRARVLKDDATDAIEAIVAIQNQRWQHIVQVVNLAGDQYTSMRLDAIEESLRDKGAPIWLSAVFAVLVSFVPVTAVSNLFLSELVAGTQRILTRSDRKIVSNLEAVIERELDDERLQRAIRSTIRSTKRISDREELVLKYAKRWDPELSNMLQNFSNQLGESLAQQPFQKEPGTDKITVRSGADVPIVVVKAQMYDWVAKQTRVESVAIDNLRNRLSGLVAIVVAPDPKSEAKDRNTEEHKRAAQREPKVPYQIVNLYPESAEDAMTELEQSVKDIKSGPSLLDRAPEIEELNDLQLMIEASIWAASYDFSLKYIASESKIGAPDVVVLPLADGLWEKLIDRFIDPDEGKSFKEVGELYRLGSRENPYFDEDVTKQILKFRTAQDPLRSADRWTPKERLSHYLSAILGDALRHETEDSIRRIKRFS
jgi:hypothetical protein